MFLLRNSTIIPAIIMPFSNFQKSAATEAPCKIYSEILCFTNSLNHLLAYGLNVATDLSLCLAAGIKKDDIQSIKLKLIAIGFESQIIALFP